MRKRKIRRVKSTYGKRPASRASTCPCCSTAGRPSFPLGKFAANAPGTVVLGMVWEIAHWMSTGGGVLGC